MTACSNTKTRITVVGDIMLDRYFVGDVERLNPEAPGVVIRVDREGDWMASTQHGFDESFGFDDAMKAAGADVKRRFIQDDRVFARKTVGFIDRHKNHPWCVYLASHAPHQKHTEDPEYRSRYADAPEDRQGLLAAMALLDDAVGMVLEKLRELNLEENTLIFFISDNGGQRYRGRSARWQLGSANTPFRATL